MSAGVKIGRLVLEMPQGSPHDAESLARRIAEELGARLAQEIENGNQPKDAESAQVEMNLPQQATIERLAQEIADKVRRQLL